MATNVTEKDKALQEVIDFCTNWSKALYDDKEGNCYENLLQADALLRVICKCQHMLDQSDTTNVYILENSDDEPETMHILERLEHERRKAWSEGYAAGWKDHECDFPPYTSGNPYKETNKIGKDGE